jgi:hypothetical protein
VTRCPAVTLQYWLRCDERCQVGSERNQGKPVEIRR